ncbi:hypothetical protein, partial [Vibrio vulnificus]|uniref:hypothetical protein n=2 Tax=Vibrio vulnificus TaxID=672 RepID=UPI0040588C64
RPNVERQSKTHQNKFSGCLTTGGIHVAALRGECRINQLSADHLHHQNQPQTKNATRHESLLNALLCLSFNDLRFTKTNINSVLTDKQKPKTRRLKRLIDLKNRLRISAIQAQKPVIKILIEPAKPTSRLPKN